MVKRQRGFRGTGSIHKDGDGYFVAAITLAADRDGKRRRLVRKSKVSAADALAKLAAAKAGDSGTIDDTVTVAAWIDYWLGELVPGTVKPQTLASYTKVCRRDIVPALGDVLLVELGPEHITRMLNRMEARGLKPSTRCHTRDVLSVALTKAEAWGKLERTNPTRLTARPKAAPVRDEWTAEQANTILAAAVGDRLEAFAVVMLYLGLRPSEALALRWEHLELGAGPALEVTASKSDAGRRTLPLPTKVAAALRAHRARQAAERLAAPYWHDRGIVFASDIGTTIDDRRARIWWAELVKAAGLPHRRLYSCRHTACTLMLNNGVPLEVVSAIAGHAGLAITADVYARVGAQLKAGAANIMDDVLG